MANNPKQTYKNLYKHNKRKEKKKLTYKTQKGPSLKENVTQ